MSEWHENARALKAAHPEMSNAEIARELGVTRSAVWKALHPDRAREMWRNDTGAARRRREWRHRHRAACTGCGHPRGIGGYKPGLCRACHEAQESARIDERAQRIVAMWHAGLKLVEIAAELGWSKNHISVEINRLREKGYDLPHRYRVKNGRQVAA